MTTPYNSENTKSKRPYRVPFWDRKTVTESGCWEWIGSKRHFGYGQVYFKGRPGRKAHRVAWERTYGPIPEGMGVLHKCDNPPCINPDHLFLGTPEDNVQDMFKKGRQRDPHSGIEPRKRSTCHPEKWNHSGGLCKICNQRRLRAEKKLNANKTS